MAAQEKIKKFKGENMQDKILQDGTFENWDWDVTQEESYTRFTMKSELGHVIWVCEPNMEAECIHALLRRKPKDLMRDYDSKLFGMVGYKINEIWDIDEVFYAYISSEESDEEAFQRYGENLTLTEAELADDFNKFLRWYRDTQLKLLPEAKLGKE